MVDPLMAGLDESRLRMMELEANPLADGSAPMSIQADEWVRRYVEEFPPRVALALVEELRELRLTLAAVVGVLEKAGFTHSEYARLDDDLRSSPEWSAVQRCWALTEPREAYLLRVTRGSDSFSRAFSSREAALAAAIESLEMCDGYPEAIQLAGGDTVMTCAEILRAWEERHDPG